MTNGTQTATDRKGVLPVEAIISLSALLIVRLPYLLSPNYVLDGDEAVVALMARELARGEAFGAFFWGQRYGFVMLETVPAALAFRVAGPGQLSVAAAMLALFMLAITLYGTAFTRIVGDRRWGWALAAGLGLLPPWIVWSARARGGYLSAFLLTGLLMYLVTRPGISRRTWIMSGCTLGFLFLSQPLWVLPAIPLMGLPFVLGNAPGRGPSQRALWVEILLPAGAVILLVSAMFSPPDPAWSPVVFDGFDPARVARLPGALHDTLTGFFYMGVGLPTPPLVRGAGAVLAGLTLVAPVLLIARAVREHDHASVLGAAALLLALTPIPFLYELAPRYLLQSTVPLLLAAALWVRRERRAFRALAGPAAAFVLCGLVVCALEFRHYRFQLGDPESRARDELVGLVERLETRGVQAVYTPSPLLQWQLRYYSDERIAVRHHRFRDRLPELAEQVDQIRASGATTALVGFAPPGMRESQEVGRDVEWVGRDYFLRLDPSTSLLESLGFELQEQR